MQIFSNGQVKNKVVVITGASAGVGRATARLFGSYGARVALISRNEEALINAVKEIEKEGGIAKYYLVDVADYKAIEEAADKIEADLGPISIWVNNAMNSVFSPFKDINNEDFKRVTEVTYLGQVYGTKAALARMRRRNKGKVVLVGSALAYRGIPLQSAYCGAKHAVQGFFDSVRTELLHEKSRIKITMVQLPALNTPQFEWVKLNLPNEPKPMGKIYQPEVAARAIYHCATHNQREMYVGWPSFQTIIGNKIWPWLGDKVLAKSGYDQQMTAEKASTTRENNLYETTGGDKGSHGRFDLQATYDSPMLWLSMNKKKIAAAIGFVMAFSLVNALRR